MRITKPKADKVMKHLQNLNVCWKDDGDRNEEAARMLSAFYFELKKCKPDKTYKCRFGNHLSYADRLLQVRAAFNENKYMRACHEILGLAHFESIFQNRIKLNLLALINDYLKIEV